MSQKIVNIDPLSEKFNHSITLLDELFMSTDKLFDVKPHDFYQIN
jgi:hypothetical protein